MYYLPAIRAGFFSNGVNTPKTKEWETHSFNEIQIERK
jgi:hypothetical protein